MSQQKVALYLNANLHFPQEVVVFAFSVVCSLPVSVCCSRDIIRPEATEFFLCWECP